jgi:hypothetical protein
MKTKRSILLQMAALMLIAAPAWAGPPLICEKFELGSAKSLPWKDGLDWHGADPSYNLVRLSDDTLSLLTPAMPVKARMETLRRAGIYATKDSGLASELTSRLLARALDSEANGKPDALAWFDAGYFAETIRQATFVYRYNMLTPSERTSWHLRGDTPRLDGYPWIQKAIRLGGSGMDYPLSLVAGFRLEDLNPKNPLTVTKR